ncbi:MAG: hypothetical protein WBG01_05600 [Bacteroidota bacterium]
MKTVTSAFLLLLLLTSHAVSEDPVSGTIYYADGSELKFQDITKITGARVDLGMDILQKRIHRLYESKEICLFYQNRDRWVQLSELEYVHVETYEVTQGHYIRGPILIRTKDGGTLMNDLELRYLVDVVVLDDSTNEIQTIDGIPFADEGDLKIRRIVFD